MAMGDDWSKYTDAQLTALLYSNRLLTFSNMDFTDREFHDFCAKFGTPWSLDQYLAAKESGPIHVGDNKYTTMYRHDSYSRLSGHIGLHADASNERHSQPLPSRALYLLTLPESYQGGETFFVDTCVAYRALPQEIKEKYENYTILYQSWQNGGTYRNWYRLIQHHPVTGEKFMMLNYCGTAGFPWILDLKDEKGDSHQVSEVADLISRHQSLSYYEHTWKKGDLIVMSNLGLLHGRTKFHAREGSTTPRAMWRCTIDHNLAHNIKPVSSIPDENKEK